MMKAISRQKTYMSPGMIKAAAFTVVFICALAGISYSQEKLPEGVEARRKLTLEECITIAIENHIPLKIGKKQLELARLRLIETKRNLGPTVTAKLESSSGKVTSRNYAGAKIALEGKQPIFYGGELVFSVRQAEVNLEVVKTDYERIKNELVLQVKKAYYSLDKTKKALVVQRKLCNRTSEFNDIAKAGYGANVISRLEFLKVSSQYNQIRFQVVSAEEDLAMANLLLQQAMNIDEEVDIVEVEEPKIITLDLETCYNLAYLNRPEIKIGQLSSEYFDYEKKIMRARTNWPRVDFLGSYGKAVEQYVKQDRSPTDDKRGLRPEFYIGTKISWPFWGNTLDYSITKEKWTPVVSTVHGTEAMTNTVSFSLFNRLEDISGFQEANLEYIRSQDNAKTKRQEITLEVKEMFFKYKKSIFLMEVTKSKIEFQASQVQILEIRSQLGEAQYSDVIEEMLKLAEEQFSYVQIIADYYIAIASLNKAIGIEGYFDI